MILLGSYIFVVIPIIVPFLVSILIFLAIPATIVTWHGSANLTVKFVLSSKQNFLVELASLEVRGFFCLNVMVDFGD